MTEKKVDTTLGQAIDEIIHALKNLDKSSRITAIRASCEHLNISLSEKPHSQDQTVEPPIQGTAVTNAKQVDIKSLKEEKKPSSANEMAALVAFYLSESVAVSERKMEVDVNDMEKYFKQAGYPLPKKTKFLLVNAKNAGYLDPVSSGTYKLNPVGYNLVTHNMPRTKSGASRRTTGKKKTAKKRKKVKKTKSKA